jgi:hypothetical protein
MEIDPHTLQLILTRIRQQMRCPQCGKQVPVDFSSVRVVSERAMLLQLKCETCAAFIVLHASLQGVEKLGAKPFETDTRRNVSSSLRLSDREVQMLRQALDESGGSFEQLFRKYGVEPRSPESDVAGKGSGTDVA